MKVTDPLWKTDCKERREKASFFPPPPAISLPGKLELNFIKMTQSGCVRAELRFLGPHCLNVLLSVLNVPRRLGRQSAHLSARTDTVAIQEWI